MGYKKEESSEKPICLSVIVSDNFSDEFPEGDKPWIRELFPETHTYKNVTLPLRVKFFGKTYAYGGSGFKKTL